MREMKDSGIEWIGDIPSNWNLIALRYLISESFSGSWGEDPKNNDNDRICMRIADFDYSKMMFKKQDESLFTVRNYSTKDIASKTLKYGDLLIEKSGGGEKTPVGRAVIFRENFQAIFANFMNCLRFKKIINLEFVKYLFYSLYQRRVTTFYINQTIGIQNLNCERFYREIKIPVPALAIQQKISDFLDKKCSEIDSLSADIQSQIDTLEEYKNSVITEAVTKGLNPDVEMKDSGIEWCPQIPSHWNQMNPKFMFKQRNERIRKGDKQLTSSQQYGIVSQEEYMQLTGNRIVTVIKDFSILKHVEPDDFVISMRSFQGGLECSNTRGCISSAYVMLIPNKKFVYAPFYRWFFKSSKYINAIQSTSNLIRDGQAMRFANFIQVRLFTIPIEEQKDIAKYLDYKCSEIDKIISEKQQELETLDEYKKSLIYEYVTGKKEIA